MSKKFPLNIKPKKSHFEIKLKYIPSKKMMPKKHPKNVSHTSMKIKSKSILQKKMKPKKHPKNVSHTLKKCPWNFPPRKVLEPKTFFCKNVL